MSIPGLSPLSFIGIVSRVQET